MELADYLFLWTPLHTDLFIALSTAGGLTLALFLKSLGFALWRLARKVRSGKAWFR